MARKQTNASKRRSYGFSSQEDALDDAFNVTSQVSELSIEAGSVAPIPATFQGCGRRDFPPRFIFSAFTRIKATLEDDFDFWWQGISQKILGGLFSRAAYTSQTSLAVPNQSRLHDGASLL